MLLKDATVLLVDDEVALLDGFGSWLKREGCRVLTAENGQQGLELATREQVDLIISDIRMPVMDGVEMVRRLNADSRYRTRVVFVSGFSEFSERDCYALGVQVTLHKPLRRAQMISAATRCLMDREEAWWLPPADAPLRTLTVRFESVADARRQGQVAFGHGGFCLQSSFAASFNEPIGL